MKYYIYLKSGRKIEIDEKCFNQIHKLIDEIPFTKTLEIRLKNGIKLVLVCEIESIEMQN